MIKLYRLEQFQDDIKLYKGIPFENGEYFSDPNRGYGIIKNGDGLNKTMVALYDYPKFYKEDFDDIKTNDGFLEDFYISHPKSVEMINKYNKPLLKDEAVLLLTQNINIKVVAGFEDKVSRIFGRFNETAGYILLPGAAFQAGIHDMNESNIKYENFELIESNGFGKQLVLTKLDR